MGSAGVARRKLHRDAHSSQTSRKPAAEGKVGVEHARAAASRSG
jgi:hypothetical protein